MDLTDLFYQMLRIRRVEEAISDRYAEQKIRCPIHLSNGQEAIAVGVMHVLKKEDEIISTHRSHAHYLAKGGDLNKMIAELHGKETGCSRGRGGSTHLVDLSVGMMGATPVSGNSLPVGLGLALATQIKKEKKIVVIFFGDGATEQGTFGEGLNFASLKNLPVLFVCENNLYSSFTPLKKRQPSARSLVDIAKAHGLYAIKEDGNVIENCIRASQAGIDAIHRGEGPAFIEFETYRFKDFSGPHIDSGGDYRATEEFQTWADRCPIKQLREKLLLDGTLTENQIDEMEMKILKEINSAFMFAKESPFPQFDLDYERAYVES